MAVHADPFAFADALGRCGYSTNPNYGALIRRIVRDYNLTQYSRHSAGRAGLRPTPPRCKAFREAGKSMRCFHISLICLAVSFPFVPAFKVLAVVAFALVVAIPPAAKVLAIVAVVYPLIQALKRIPAFTPHLSGWVAILVNILLSALALILTVPAAQLYTTDTFVALVTVALAAAVASMAR